MTMHSHSEFSLLDGRARTLEMANAAKANGFTSLAVTDHDEVGGHMDFAKSCHQVGIKPVFGTEARWVHNITESRREKTSGRDSSHIVLLAGDQTGLRNLWTMSSLAYEPHYFYGKPQLDLNLMREHSAGLWASDGCFAGEERYSTIEGFKTFADTVGTTQKVLGRSGRGPAWTDGEIRSFGQQEIVELTISRDGREKTIRTTANHRWFVLGSNRRSIEVLTSGLNVGDRLTSLAPPVAIGRTTPSAVGIQAGVVFGDGTVDRGNTGRRSARVKLYGTKDAELLKWFPLQPTTACQSEDAIEVRGLPGYFKDRPSLTDSGLNYLYGWLAGYFAADGSVSQCGSASLSSARRENLDFVRDVCQVLGVRTGEVRAEERVAPLPQGSVSHNPLYKVVLDIANLHDDFFLITAHRDRIAQRRQRKIQGWSEWSVESVVYTGQVEEVFCAVVPAGHAFTLDGDVFTGNCGLTRFARSVEEGNIDKAREEIALLQGIFGDRFYSELHTFQIIDPVTDEDKALNAKITAMNEAKVALSKEMGFRLVVVNDSHYAYKHQWEEHRLVYNLSTQAYRRDQVESMGQAADWMMNRDEMIEWMGRHGICRSVIEEAIDNGIEIAEQCNAEIKPTLSMPRLYKTDADDAAAFRRNIEQGFTALIVEKGLDEDLYRQRLEYEAKLIIDKGMASYFNVVGDYVLAARNGSYRKWIDPRGKLTPCLCGPGRGSGGGSLVNYVLGITSLDPIKHDLMFERFINPDRPDYPDIDVDFAKSARQGVKDYLGARYGQDNVVSIGTRARSGPKQMVKDLGRALEIPYSDILAIVDLISEIDNLDLAEDESPDEEHVSWSEVIAELDSELAPWAKKYPLLFNRLESMVGLVRQAGVHAAGVIINPEPLQGRLPTRVKKGVRASQVDMHNCAALGGVKLDLLANKGLDVLTIARDLILARHRVWIDYDGFGMGIPTDQAVEVITLTEDHFSDPAIWEQIDRGQTAGVFQIGTPGGTKQAMRFKPRNLADLADLVAINRPGVIRAGQLEPYLARRNGDEDITYDHPLMEPITRRTMGILVYQEDMMRTAVVLAGFTPGESEGLRKAIGKKMADKIAEIRPKFLDGCMANPEFTGQGGTRGIATKIWSSLEAAGAYSFNKAHSVGYAMQACWEIWTKHHFFDEFITACLAVVPEKTTLYLREARKRERPILPPDINESGTQFTLTGSGIRYGLTDVKGVGEKSVATIIKNRPYRDFKHFWDRNVGTAGISKSTLDPLIRVGAFDSLNPNRQELLDYAYYQRAGSEVAPLKWSKLSQDERDEIVSLKLAKSPHKYPVYRFSDEKVIIDTEMSLLGTHVTIDPMAKWANMIEGACINHPAEIDDFDTGSRFTVGGQVTAIRKHVQKNNNRDMAFITISWREEEFEVVAFADAWEANRRMLTEVGIPVACDVIKLPRRGCQLSVALRLDWM